MFDELKLTPEQRAKMFFHQYGNGQRLTEPPEKEVLDFVKKVTREEPNAYTIRTTAEFVSDYTNELYITNDIKQK